MGGDNTPRHLDKFYCGCTITLPNWRRMHHSIFFTHIIMSVQSKGR